MTDSDYTPIMPPPGTRLPEACYYCDNCNDSIEPAENLWWAPDSDCWCCEMCLDDLGVEVDGVMLAKWLEVTRDRT